MLPQHQGTDPVTYFYVVCSFLIVLSLLAALAIYLDDRPRKKS